MVNQPTSEANADLMRACDLWVFPPPRSSTWFTRMDWYLNWQMCKGMAYPGLFLPNETRRVADEFQVPVPKPEKPSDTLLVGSEGLVPARRCAVVLEPLKLTDWLKRVRILAEQIQAAQIHVFLPTGFSLEDGRAVWKKFESEIDATFSPDQESAT